jgi:hypothetical protein
MTASGTFVPNISITSTKNSICQNEIITYTSSIVNGGNNPDYQWKVNGANVGSNVSTFSTGALNNGDEVTCVLTSNDQCLATTTVTSNTKVAQVASSFTPAVAITSSQSNICSGTTVTFSYQITQGNGQISSFQWFKNNVAVTTSGNTYSSNAFQNGDVVKCVVSSSSACATTPNATSNSITLTSSATVTPTVTVSTGGVTSSSITICGGATKTFDATTTNGGSNPSFQWKINGSNVGINSSSYTSNQLQNGDNLTCVMTSNAGCTSTATVTSSGIAISVSGVSVTPTTSLTASATDICSGTEVMFTATTTDAGSTPTYQWTKNGNVIPNATTDQYITSNTANGDMFVLNVYSQNKCATGGGVSNSINMIVRQTPSKLLSVGVNTLTAIESDASYAWGDCIAEGPVVGATAQTFAPSTSGTYAVQITKNGCVAISDCKPISITSVNEFDSKINLLNVFPNPSGDIITFSEHLDTPIYIHDELGQVVKILMPNHSNSYQIHDLKEGVYIIQTEYLGETMHQKFIISK